MRTLGSKTFQYQVEKKQTMHSVSSGERTRRRLNPTSLIAAQLSYVGQAYPLLEGPALQSSLRSNERRRVLQDGDVLFITEELQNFLLAESSGKTSPSR